MSLAGIHGAPRLASMSPGSTSSGCTALQGGGIAGILRAGGLSGGELGPHVAGEIGVGGLPGSGLRVGEDEVAQFGNDFRFGFAVKLADERQIDLAALVEGDQQAFLGAFELA